MNWYFYLIKDQKYCIWHGVCAIDVSSWCKHCACCGIQRFTLNLKHCLPMEKPVTISIISTFSLLWFTEIILVKLVFHLCIQCYKQQQIYRRFIYRWTNFFQLYWLSEYWLSLLHSFKALFTIIVSWFYICMHIPDTWGK